jgi:uncharacterized phage protein gp47/JayE
MPIVAQSESQIFGDILYKIANDTNITRSSPGSKTRAIAEAVSQKMGQMYTKFDTNLAQAFVYGAGGQYLDFIGNLLGVSRISPQTASSPAIEKSVRFYEETGTFGSINSGSNITIPANTIISTGVGATGIQYKIPFNTILRSGDSQLYVDVESIRLGSSSNVGIKQLIHHNFTNYTDVLNESLKVINDVEITRGADIESDTNYKFRITNQTLVSEGANITAIRLAALTVPGVSDVIVIPFFSGIGTFEILVKSISPTITTGLLNAITRSVESVTALGCVSYVRGPKEVGIAMTANLILRQRVTPTEETAIINATVNNVSNYIDNLDIGQELILQEIIQIILASSDLIKNVGTYIKPFESVYVYKPTKLETSKIRSTLIEDYTAASDERVIVENVYAGTTPLLFRITY